MHKESFSFLKLKFFNANILVLNEIEKIKLIKLGFDTNKIEIVKMPIVLNKNKIYKNNADALYVGRFHAQKELMI